ncbi:MAG: hypothetical protein M3081_22675, partial [Gemmatimonadota bacterium]|nr:hypothetical protein [Gemmatimonadota bacterium]
TAPPSPTGSHTTGPQRVRTPLQRRLVAIFTERLHLKAAALLFAVLLWVVVSADEVVEELVKVDVALTLDSSIELRAPLPQVRALVVGRARELLKLYANPPTVRRRLTAEVPDSMLLEIRPGDVDLSGVDAQVREIEPRAIPVKFDVTMQRWVRVRSALKVSSDTALHGGALVFEPESVLVRGRRGVVRALGAVSTVSALYDVHDSASQLVPLDTSGLAVSVAPSRVRVHVRLPSNAVHDSAAGSAGDGARATHKDTTRTRRAARRP